MSKLLCFTILLLSTAICSSLADRLNDALTYIDEVLTVYVPWSVEEAGLDPYEMPDFSHNFQNRSSDGAAINTKVKYHSGNLTGLDNVHRIDCQEPGWSYSNISFECNIFLPRVEVNYEGEFTEFTGHQIYARFRQHPFSLNAVVEDLRATLEITSSPHVQVPTLKSITLNNQGTPQIYYTSKEDLSYELLSGHFFHKFSSIFKELFDGPYKRALNRAVASVRYPEKL